MAITLDATTKSIDLTTSSTADIDYAVSWVDMTTTAFTPGDGHGTINTATTTVIVAAPGASTQRGVKSISVFNRHVTTANTVTVKKDVSATEYCLFKATLSAGESLQWTDGGEWGVFDLSGRRKTASGDILTTTTRPVPFIKQGTAPDATSFWYSFSKDSGTPNQWSPGTPGVNGRVTDGMTAADVGCLRLWTPTGSLYLSSYNITATVTHSYWLYDVLWVNTGLVVTTTTAQALTSPTLPARDAVGGTNGEGCLIGLLTTTANTNGANITNSTVTYTNSAGTGSRTATISNTLGDQIPATPVAGTIAWFNLQAGDTGVRSIQSVTLGTSLGGGTISMIIARPILNCGIALANAPMEKTFDSPGIRLYTGSTLLWFLRALNTTNATLTGGIYVTER